MNHMLRLGDVESSCIFIVIFPGRAVNWEAVCGLSASMSSALSLHNLYPSGRAAHLVSLSLCILLFVSFISFSSVFLHIAKAARPSDRHVIAGRFECVNVWLGWCLASLPQVRQASHRPWSFSSKPPTIPASSHPLFSNLPGPRYVATSPAPPRSSTLNCSSATASFKIYVSSVVFCWSADSIEGGRRVSLYHRAPISLPAAQAPKLNLQILRLRARLVDLRDRIRANRLPWSETVSAFVHKRQDRQPRQPPLGLLEAQHRERKKKKARACLHLVAAGCLHNISSPAHCVGIGGWARPRLFHTWANIRCAILLRLAFTTALFQVPCLPCSAPLATSHLGLYILQYPIRGYSRTTDIKYVQPMLAR